MLAEQLMLCVDGASDTVPMKLEDTKQLVSCYCDCTVNVSKRLTLPFLLFLYISGRILSAT
jgi:hypothetical protein